MVERKNIKCVDVQKEIISLNPLTKAVETHLQLCAKCRRFKDEFQSIQTTLSQVEIKITPTLSTSTLSSALSILKNGKRLTLVERFKNYWHSPKFAFGLAALFLVGFSCILVVALLTHQGNASNKFIIYVLITIFVQNLIMAFFIPLFFNQSNLKTPGHQNI